MKPVIFGCSGPVLSDVEREFFATVQPVGFILFARNIQSPQQLLTLTTDLRLCLDRPDVLIAIDQEGGRVQRMTVPHWQKYPPMAVFGDCASIDRTLAEHALAMNCMLIADDLRRVGINVDCLPVLDVPVDDGDQIIGDRAFAKDPELVAELGRIVVDSFTGAGVLPVMKHIPGHGRALVDSHKDLPRVSTPLDTLRSTDFTPFKSLADCPLGMTAHIVFEDIDPGRPATTSSRVITDVIRGELGFEGILMTDDLSMDALQGDMADRATASLAAGCDLILHCNGDMNEMKAVAGALDTVPGQLQTRLNTLMPVSNSNTSIDRNKLEADYCAAMKRLYRLIEG